MPTKTSAARLITSISLVCGLAMAGGLSAPSWAGPKKSKLPGTSPTAPRPRPPLAKPKTKTKTKAAPSPKIDTHKKAPHPSATATGPSKLFVKPLNKAGPKGMKAAAKKLVGLVDLHTHPMAHLGFGGHLLHGAPDVDILLPAAQRWRGGSCNDEPVRAESEEDALGSCYATHGPRHHARNRCGNHIRRLVLDGMENGNSANKPHGKRHPKGAPTFEDWPKHNDILHQQMWVDWIERSYDGGMRVMVALAVNNYTLATGMEASAANPRNDKDSADLQIAELKRMVGRHPWMEIALTPADVRRIVGRDDKMAIVIGVEIDDIGDYVRRRVKPTPQAVRQELQRLHTDGVRYIFPVHMIDNEFGSAAVYENEVNRTNCYHTGQWWNLGCAPASDKIAFRAGSGVDWAASLKLGSCGGSAPLPAQTCEPGQGHKNMRPVPGLAAAALGEMMRLGMIIDIDHASQTTVDRYFELTKTPGGDYPLVSGHNTMRHGAHASENNRTDAQYTTLAARGGIAGVGWGSLKSNEWLTELGKVHATGISIAIGSDINGMVVQPAQRSGCGPTTPCVTYNAAFPQMTHGSKTFDYNTDGVANIGLFPDLLRDVEGQGPKGKQMVAELFEGAEGFASMWEKAWKLRSHAPSGAPPANAISNIRASYGRNCGMTADRGDITSFVSDKCVGQMSCRYNFTWEKWGGDPAPSTCSKEIVIDYKCGGNAKQKKVMHRRTPQGVDIACP